MAGDTPPMLRDSLGGIPGPRTLRSSQICDADVQRQRGPRPAAVEAITRSPARPRYAPIPKGLAEPQASALCSSLGVDFLHARGSDSMTVGQREVQPAPSAAPHSLGDAWHGPHQQTPSHHQYP